MLKKFLLICFALLTVSVYAEDILYCRSGKITAAQLTTAKINIAKLPPELLQQFPQNCTYAVVSLQLNDMCKISIFDYVLEISDIKFPCYALMRNGKFEYFTEEISGKGNMQMLFPLNSLLLSSQGKIDITLKSNLADPKNIYEIQIPFSAIGSKTPTPAASIPSTGILELPEK